jgi:rhamnosyltransferase subunit B
MEPPRRVVLNTIGSFGDLHPFIALALELKRHDVFPVVASFGRFREKVEAEGLEFQATEPDLPTVFRDLGMDEPEAIRHLIESDEFLFRDVLFPHIRAAYENALLIQAGADLVLTSSIAFGARIAAEKARIPWLAIVLQPLMFMSAYDPPMVPRPAWIGPVLRRLGPKVARVAINVSKGILLRALTRPVAKFRAEIGLPNGREDCIFDGQFSAAGAIGLYSPLLGPSQPDHPAPSEIVGFAYYDSEKGGVGTLDPELDRFVADGPAPVVVTLGSVAVNYSGAEAFFRDSLAAARQVGRRAVLLVGDRVDPALQEREGGGDFLVRRYVPHSQLFPHAAVIVHQGGVGTLAQAMRAGRPELVVPFYGDQFDNADRASRLGVGRSIHYRRYEAATAAQAMGRLLLQDSTYEQRARDVAAQMASENGAQRAAELVRRFLDSGTITAGCNSSSH